MCIDPATAMMMIGTGVKMFGAVRDGAHDGRKQDENATRQAHLVNRERSRHSKETARKRDEAKQVSARKLAAMTENGIQIDGSAHDAIDDSVRDIGQDIKRLDQNSQARRQDMIFEGSRFRAAGRSARKKGKFNAFAKLIDGGTKLVGSF